MANQHVYLKRLVFSNHDFDLVNERINNRYNESEDKSIKFETFYSWSLFATVSGLFTGYGDVESTVMFLECMTSGKMPELSIVKFGKEQVQICICIKKEEETADVNSRSKKSYQ